MFHPTHRPGRRSVSRQGQAVVLDAPPKTFRLMQHVPRLAGPGEAQVRVHAVGISRSDRDVHLGRRPVPYVRYPVTPGHEWSGTVTAVGEGAPAPLLGRKVVGEGLRTCGTCGTCAPCRDGETNLCTLGYEETGFTLPGAMAPTLVYEPRPNRSVPSLRSHHLWDVGPCLRSRGLRRGDRHRGHDVERAHRDVPAATGRAPGWPYGRDFFPRWERSQKVASKPCRHLDGLSR